MSYTGGHMTPVWIWVELTSYIHEKNELQAGKKSVTQKLWTLKCQYFFEAPMSVILCNWFRIKKPDKQK